MAKQRDIDLVLVHPGKMVEGRLRPATVEHIREMASHKLVRMDA